MRPASVRRRRRGVWDKLAGKAGEDDTSSSSRRRRREREQKRVVGRGAVDAFRFCAPQQCVVGPARARAAEPAHDNKFGPGAGLGGLVRLWLWPDTLQWGSTRVCRRRAEEQS
jgi:hypothetical protein